jgi:hypothetical protein
LLAAAVSPGPAPAASGLAYGSVMKFEAGSGGTPPTPGTYRTDFDTAATPAAGGSTPHMPFGLGHMMARAQSAMAMFQNGIAEKHYIGTNRERIDQVAAQTADITDCTARTITHLDLAKKTYSVVSLDGPAATAPPSGGGHRSAPGPAPTDDGTRVTMTVSTRALGLLTIDGVATNGYETKITMTATNAAGESHTQNMLMTAYYAALEEPHFACAERGMGPAIAAGPGAASLASLAMAMRALRTPAGDSRFTVTSSGPALPTGKLAMWQNVTMSATEQGHSGSIDIVTERGDLRAPLPDSDPVFSVPPDFTKVDG